MAAHRTAFANAKVSSEFSQARNGTHAENLVQGLAEQLEALTADCAQLREDATQLKSESADQLSAGFAEKLALKNLAESAAQQIEALTADCAQLREEAARCRSEAAATTDQLSIGVAERMAFQNAADSADAAAIKRAVSDA